MSHFVELNGRGSKIEEHKESVMNIMLSSLELLMNMHCIEDYMHYHLGILSKGHKYKHSC